MTKYAILSPLVLIAVITLAIAFSAPGPVADAGKHKNEIEFGATKIFFEYNASDQDLGIQIFFDGQGWEEVEVSGPDGTIFEVENDEGLQDIGSTEVFTESAEPPLDEANLEEAIEEFLSRFPEGEYEFEGVTTEGDELEGTAELTHDLPAMVEVEVDGFPLLEWTPGDGGPEVVRYQAVAEIVAEDDEGEEQVYVQTVDLPASITEFTVSPEFADLAEDLEDAGALLELKFEVIAEEESGNKTITEASIFEAEE